jgi:hypothetical protein
LSDGFRAGVAQCSQRNFCKNRPTEAVDNFVGKSSTKRPKGPPNRACDKSMKF